MKKLLCGALNLTSARGDDRGPRSSRYRLSGCARPAGTRGRVLTRSGGRPRLLRTYDGRTIIAPSSLGLVFKRAAFFHGDDDQRPRRRALRRDVPAGGGQVGACARPLPELSVSSKSEAGRGGSSDYLQGLRRRGRLSLCDSRAGRAETSSRSPTKKASSAFPRTRRAGLQLRLPLHTTARVQQDQGQSDRAGLDRRAALVVQLEQGPTVAIAEANLKNYAGCTCGLGASSVLSSRNCHLA